MESTNSNPAQNPAKKSPSGFKPILPKSGPKSGPNIWMVATIILAIILVGVLVSKTDLSQKEGSLEVVEVNKAADDLVIFINEVYGPQIGMATLKGVVEENGLYKVTLTAPDTTGQVTDQDVYVTRDSQLFVPQVINVQGTLDQFHTFQAEQQAALEAQNQPPAEEVAPEETAPEEPTEE